VAPVVALTDKSNGYEEIVRWVLAFFRSGNYASLPFNMVNEWAGNEYFSVVPAPGTDAF
jgi:hypothetical protein